MGVKIKLAKLLKNISVSMINLGVVSWAGTGIEDMCESIKKIR